MELLTQRLRLIPCTEETVAAAEYETGPHIKMHLKELKENPELKGWGVWYVIDSETDSIIGDIGFKGKPTPEKTVEVGYGILPSAQNRGYATEAMGELIRWAFTSPEVDKVTAECLDDNFPSIKVLEKLKMVRTGIEDNMLKWELAR
ncbi:GNAT family N-acetyltransferase [Evansella sp. LMS18]|jgi:ribosomal-protein-alanine N-acetyltransferase|uniref:GNAT family N-acetyltransferase n=1 Tax=Evansella sp. LMS18 TaxID=2924033 RepID=UPI0020D0F7B6|nr:GNAT family N-acetyltransferase [Evansella sp. LMS18]UTR12599.1 GNAT family N-acetyltransferase [Evansella sp. LMS18]